MEEMYRVHRVAQILDCSRKYIYNLIIFGKLEAVRLGPRQIRIPRSCLEQFLADRKQEGE
ncbi:MAG TPA: helix-turn-helix domain-containing protein [Candidatus Sumerlaeota bacterium]|nr:helix-turn-helix domain-containing protein [Candidatus Sumerlaeota bacterium]